MAVCFLAQRFVFHLRISEFLPTISLLFQSFAALLPQDTSSANISVTGCLSHFVRARVLADGSCSGGVRLSANTTTHYPSGGSGRRDNVTNLPYPEPGVWYLTLAVRCYRPQLHAR